MADCLHGYHYLIRIAPDLATTNFRRTGGCLAITKGSPATYDGCILRPDMIGELVMELKVCQVSPKEIIVTVIDKTSADLYPEEVVNNTLIARKTPGGPVEYEDCWTSQNAKSPDTVETPCFANGILNDQLRVGPDRFMVRGKVDEGENGIFQFSAKATQRTGHMADRAPHTPQPWFDSNDQSGNFCPGGDLTGGWPERIQVKLDLTFTGSSVSGSMLYTDRDPDRTATRQCLNRCPTYINPGGTICNPTGRGFCPYANTDPRNCTARWEDLGGKPVFYDLFPYCNPSYLASTFSGSCQDPNDDDCGFFNLTDGSTPLTCDYANCPPWVEGMTGILREFPFCARVTDLPCDVGGVTEQHCSNGNHDDNAIAPGSSAEMDKAAELCNSLVTAEVKDGRCFRGPAPCCKGAPADTSWDKCRNNGVRPLSQPPFSGYALPPESILADWDYECPLGSPPPPARLRNRLLPFDCNTARAEGCTADDVSIEFDIVSIVDAFVEAGITCP
jgi:hypothetical protein